MFNLKSRIAKSFFTDYDIASIEVKTKNKLSSLVPVPINSLKLIPTVREKLNKLREKRRIVELYYQKLAVFVPYRNREAHLKIFIPEITAFLKKKKIDYKIFVIMQSDNGFFNRGSLLNVGVKKYGKRFDYYCFHDVDFIPIRADYNYCNQPLRLITAFFDEKKKVPKEAGKGVYNHHFAGVVSIPKNAFHEVNGFSNLYHHYGLEDDDLFMRLLFKKFLPCMDLSGYYYNLSHFASKKILPSGQISSSFFEKRILKQQLSKNKKLFSLIKRRVKKPDKEGLSTILYKEIKEQIYPNYTFLSVKLLGSASSLKN